MSGRSRRNSGSGSDSGGGCKQSATGIRVRSEAGCMFGYSGEYANEQLYHGRRRLPASEHVATRSTVQGGRLFSVDRDGAAESSGYGRVAGVEFVGIPREHGRERVLRRLRSDSGIRRVQRRLFRRGWAGVAGSELVPGYRHVRAGMRRGFRSFECFSHCVGGHCWVILCRVDCKRDGNGMRKQVSGSAPSWNTGARRAS